MTLSTKFVAMADHRNTLRQEQYRASQKIISSSPAGRLRAPRLMIGVYAWILKGMLRAGWRPPRRRISLGKGRLAWVVLTRGLAR